MWVVSEHWITYGGYVPADGRRLIPSSDVRRRAKQSKVIPSANLDTRDWLYRILIEAAIRGS